MTLRKRIWGWFFFDWASQPYHTLLVTFIFGPYFAGVAAGCGYRKSYRCDGLGGFAEALKSGQSGRGPHLIHMRIAPGSMKDLGRPSVKPPEVALRFKEFLASGAGEGQKASAGLNT